MFFGCKPCRVIEYQYNLSNFGFGFIFCLVERYNEPFLGMGWCFNSGPSNAHWSPTRIFDHLKGLEDFFDQRSMAVNIGSSFFWKEALIPSCFGWYFSYIWKSKILLHLQALMVSDGILLHLFLKGWRVTRSFPMSFPWGISFLLGPGCGAWGRVLPQKKMVENWWNWCFWKASKMIWIPRLLLARRFKWGHQWSTSGPPVECRLLGDTHHDKRDPCVAVALSLRIWRTSKTFLLTI